MTSNIEKHTCATCPTHPCCRDIKTRTTIRDLHRLERMGNQSFPHDSFQELNQATKPGVNYYIAGVVYIQLNGWFAGFNQATGRCKRHSPIHLPEFCEVIQEGGELCPSK